MWLHATIVLCATISTSYCLGSPYSRYFIVGKGTDRPTYFCPYTSRLLQVEVGEGKWNARHTPAPQHTPAPNARACAVFRLLLPVVERAHISNLLHTGALFPSALIMIICRTHPFLIALSLSHHSLSNLQLLPGFF